MLSEIYCDKFKTQGDKPRGKILFQKGLNTVLDGKKGENSIGKAIFMLIVDYCFGGDTYSKADSKNYVLDNTICFAFEFEGQKQYFSRVVSKPTDVNICNPDYTVKETIKIKAFRELLMKNYGLPITVEAKFRELVGRFLEFPERIMIPIRNR